MNWDSDLSDMMLLSFRVIESENGKKIMPGYEWKNDAQVLGVKIFRHIASAQQVSAGINFQYENTRSFSHIDHSSVAVIVRAAIEAYLAFNYIFANNDENLSVYRHKLWRRSGLIERGKLQARTSESKETLSQEEKFVETLTQEIINSTYYLESNRDNRKEINNGGWKPKGSWYAITGNTDIHQRYFSDIYNHLSGHSHGSYISVIQIRDAVELEHQSMLAGGARQILCMIISHFLFSYIKVFPRAKETLESDTTLFKIANKWHIQKEDLIRTYGETAS